MPTRHRQSATLAAVQTADRQVVTSPSVEPSPEPLRAPLGPPIPLAAGYVLPSATARGWPLRPFVTCPRRGHWPMDRCHLKRRQVANRRWAAATPRCLWTQSSLDGRRYRLSWYCRPTNRSRQNPSGRPMVQSRQSGTISFTRDVWLPCTLLRRRRRSQWPVIRRACDAGEVPPAPLPPRNRGRVQPGWLY